MIQVSANYIGNIGDIDISGLSKVLPGLLMI